MAEKGKQAIDIYSVLEQKISEEDFAVLANIVNAQGGLGELYREVKGRAQKYRLARENYTLSGEADAAEAQQEYLHRVERHLAILEYLRFA